MDHPNEPKRRSPRRQTVVDRKYQFVFAFQVFVVHTVVVLSVFFIVQNTVGEHVLGNSTAAIVGLEALEIELLSNVLRVGVITGALIIFLAFWFSNRVVGPIPRLRRALEAAGRGDFSKRLKFRPGDALAPVAEDYNRVMISLQRREAKREKELAQAEASPEENPEVEETLSPSA
jgi:methyl-accepting chemotaxis protein